MDKFGKIRRHHWKERFQISRIATFESDLLKTNQHTAPQSREILQTFVWWRAQTWWYRETVVQILHNSGWKQKFEHQRNYTKQD